VHKEKRLSDTEISAYFALPDAEKPLSCSLERILFLSQSGSDFAANTAI